MEKLNFDKKTLRKFGITIGIVLLIVTLFIFIREKYIAILPVVISAIFFTFASLIPNALKPIYFLWMKLAFILGWINTRLILIIIFYLVFTPIGILMKIFRIVLLDLKIEKDKSSYWRKKELKEFTPLDYERQF